MDIGEILLYARIAKQMDDYQVMDSCVELLKELYLCAKRPEDIAIKEDLYRYWKCELEYLYLRLGI